MKKYVSRLTIKSRRVNIVSKCDWPRLASHDQSSASATECDYNRDDWSTSGSWVISLHIRVSLVTNIHCYIDNRSDYNRKIKRAEPRANNFQMKFHIIRIIRSAKFYVSCVRTCRCCMHQWALNTN